MRSFALSELVQPLQAELVGADVRFESVTTDSRDVCAGQLFVALQGERFDGHRFLAAVAAEGASAALVAATAELDASCELPQLQVADTRAALGRLASLNRQYFEGTLMGITGSCGKTSVKNMLSAICSGHGPTLATRGNFNNEIGVPLTLLQLQPQHRYAVVEMGAARTGDIAYLCELARPGIAVLLNALPAHLEGFGSVANVARAKGEILSGLAGRGSAVFPHGNEYSALWRELAGSADCLDFGFDAGAAVRALNVVTTAEASSFLLQSPLGEVSIELPLPGHHNIANALAAAAAALAAGIELPQIAAGLARTVAESGRLSERVNAAGVSVIDDSYNANPASAQAAIEVLAVHPGRRVLVLGTMAELGSDSDALHCETGIYAAAQGIDELWAVGAHTDEAVRGFGDGGRWFADRDSLLRELTASLGEGDVVLVKGSRSAGMEAVVERLMLDPERGED
ncbi:MAG: UDP-N-acetylmuramoyl-tripeptide--D-alanyl-D-alanine ligase [Halieaceae bacterium]